MMISEVPCSYHVTSTPQLINHRLQAGDGPNHRSLVDDVLVVAIQKPAPAALYFRIHLNRLLDRGKSGGLPRRRSRLGLPVVLPLSWPLQGRRAPGRGGGCLSPSDPGDRRAVLPRL